MSELKLCKDCRWFRRDRLKCMHAESLVDSGDVVVGGTYRLSADSMRTDSPVLPCGRDGKLWEPRPRNPFLAGFVEAIRMAMFWRRK